MDHIVWFLVSVFISMAISLSVLFIMTCVMWCFNGDWNSQREILGAFFLMFFPMWLCMYMDGGPAL